MEIAKPIGIAPQMVVTDAYRTTSYFRDVLDFTIIGLAQEPPVCGLVQRHGFQLHFAQPDKLGIHLNKKLLSISHDFILWVPEIDIFLSELQSRIVKIIEGIVRRP
jgi:hypothetical protein